MEQQLQLAREVRLLGELNEWLQSSRSLDELFDMVGKFMTHILPHCEGSIYVYSNSRDVLDGCTSWNGASHKDHIQPESCWGLRRGRTFSTGESEVSFTCEHIDSTDDRPYFCFPILAHGETVGLMTLKAASDATTEDFEAGKRLSQMCAEQISMAIANVRMRDQLHDQSVRDPLTGLFNRRHLTESLRKMITRSVKDGSPLSIVSIDVDHFKKFNDNHGHDAGDMVLRAVGSAMVQLCDGDEVACRQGGEEFMMLLPYLSKEETFDRAEKLRKTIEEITVRYGEKNLPKITISIGLAHFPDHGTMPQDLMRAADEALYEAKAKGRNQTVIADHAQAAEDLVEQ
jgi:diguanylate cyclase (GGDEF)-like protein